LSDRELTLADGSKASVMSIITVPVDRNQLDPLQPENWVIADGLVWSSANHIFQRPPITRLLETPNSLWLEPGARIDRLDHAYLVQHPPGQTLYCIRPEAVKISASTNRFGKERKRLIFRYHGVEYDLSLTDPVAIAEYCPRVPARGQPATDIVLAPARTVLTVSLAGEYEGYHYKLVATIIEGT
jgi:hypothetical protein